MFTTLDSSQCYNGNHEEKLSKSFFTPQSRKKQQLTKCQYLPAPGIDQQKQKQVFKCNLRTELFDKCNHRAEGWKINIQLIQSSIPHEVKASKDLYTKCNQKSNILQFVCWQNNMICLFFFKTNFVQVFFFCALLPQFVNLRKYDNTPD